MQSAPPSNPSGTNIAGKAAGVGLLAGIFANKVLFISIIIHLIFGAGATYYVVQRIALKRKMTFQGGPPTTNPSKRALEHKVALGKKKAMMSAPAQAKRITTSGLAKIALPDMPTMPSASDVAPTRMAGMGGVGTGIGGGGGGGMGGGGGSGINFFGLRSMVRNVVFVVDISNSMVSGAKSARTWEILEKEVSKAVMGLDPLAKFGMVAFAADAEAYRTGLSVARSDEKSRALSWLKKQSPIETLDPKLKDDVRHKHTGTRADLGLKLAFAMKPDTIIFVSDGEPTGDRPAGILQDVADSQKALGRAAAIHVIAYIPDDGEAFLQDLARANGGTYKLVNLNEVAK